MKEQEANPPTAIVAGSLGLRDHAERIFGFNQVMASEFSQLDVLPSEGGMRGNLL
jgi:hypothetical protein